MKNSDKPIHPVILRQIGENEFRVASHKDQIHGEFLSSHNGLTKREYFAAMSLQALITHYPSYVKGGKDKASICKDAIEIADELLKQLEK